MFVCGYEMTYLYRFFDADGRLLYVGMSYRIEKRLDKHRVAKPWNQIARIEIAQFPTRTDAVAAEREAILSEAPAWNVVYVPLEFPA